MRATLNFRSEGIMPGTRTTCLEASLLTLLLISNIPCHASDPLPAQARADRVIVEKKARTLTLLDHGKVLKDYKIAPGGNPVGPKVRRGDHKTPEGVYVLDRRNRHSQFYRSLHISYPNAEDRARARKLKIPPGGDIMIHGLPNDYGWLGSAHRAHDWTDGCIAVTNEEIEEIWRVVPEGTTIEIRP
jgi:murein L,D-transpeptidase YafK